MSQIAFPKSWNRLLSDTSGSSSGIRVPTEFPRMEPRPKLNSDWVDWRSACSSIQDLNAHMLQSGLYSDVTFVVEETNHTNKPEPIRAHQFILRSRSPVFETMFAEAWNKSKTIGSQAIVVKLVDTSYEHFVAFLKFLYSDHFDEDLSKDGIIGLLYLAHKYTVVSLAQKCAQGLQKLICLKNVIEVYDVGELFQQYDLRDVAFEFMRLYAESLFNEPSFLEISVSLLKKLLVHDELQIEEVNIFGGLIRWANHKAGYDPESEQGKQQCADSLKEIIPFVRFTTMDPQQFTNVLDKVTTMLDKDEIITIYQHLTTRYPPARRELPQLRFNTQKRRLQPIELSQRYSVGLYLFAESCDRNSLNYFYGPNGRIHEETIQLTTNYDIIVHGIGMFGPMLPPCPLNDYGYTKYQVDLTMSSVDTSGDNPRTIMSRVRQTNSVAGDYDVEFDKPVQMLKNKVYQIQLAFKGEETKHGVKGLSTIKANCAGRTIVFHIVSPRLQDSLYSSPHGRIRSINFEMDG